MIEVSEPPVSRDEFGNAQTEKPPERRAALEALVRAATAAKSELAEAVAIVEAYRGQACVVDMVAALAVLSSAIDAADATLGPRVHRLKADPGPFRQVKAGLKPFEVRKFDRDYRVGDVLLLLEYDRETREYSGDKLRVRVISMVRPGEYGLPPDVGVLGIEPIVEEA